MHITTRYLTLSSTTYQAATFIGLLSSIRFCLCEFVHIEPKEHLCSKALMLDNKLFDKNEVKALYRSLRFPHTKFVTPCLRGLRFVQRGTFMLVQESAFPKVLPQSWKHTVV